MVWWLLIGIFIGYILGAVTMALLAIQRKDE